MAEVLLACGCSFVGGGIGSAVTMLVWSRAHQVVPALDDSWDDVDDAELDGDAWASAVSWASRQGRPQAAGLAVGYLRDSAEYLIRQRRNR